MKRSVKIPLLLLAGVVLLTLAADAKKGPVGVVPGQYIVVFQDNVDNPRGLANALAREHGFALRQTYAFALKGFAARMPATVAQRLALDPDVAYVEPDVYAYAILHENNFQTLPTGVDRIDADLNATANINEVDDRVDVGIAIFDTGIDLDHPDLNVFRAVDCTKGPNCEKGGDGDDGNGHGSAVAGIAAALDNGIGVVGVAPGARLWAVKVLRNDGSGFFSDIIEGIDYVTKNAGEIEVVNMSLTGQGKLDSLRTAIQNSVAIGVVYVVAAGNASPGNASKDVYGDDGFFETTDDIIPAAYPEVATISAMGDSDGQVGGLGPDTSDGLDDTLATFSNFSNSVVAGNPVTSPGAAIDLAGPGVDITTTAKDGLYFVDSFSGTSASSPHVAGAAALEAATNGRATDAAGVAAIRQALIDAAEGQAYWGPADTNDPDSNPEGLANVASGSPNYAPVVSITSPADGSTFNSGDSISFEGTASDTEDGNLTASLVWTSDIDGQIGTGGSFSTTLSDGNHTITASVTDSGNKTGIASISVTVEAPPPPPNDAPTVSITSPADSSTFDSGATILFEGTASDTEDGDLTASLVWTSDIDGQIGTGGSFSTTLSDGSHIITAEVTDSGNKTGIASISITVGTAPTEPTTVSVDAITYATDGGKNKDKHLLITVALADNLANPVGGASVSIDLFRDSSLVLSGAGTTGTDGTVTFTLNNAASGLYTTTVTDVTAAGLTWDGITPANGFDK